MMKPYRRGMTEAVTRDGQEVTQLVEFDRLNENGEQSLYGVVKGEVASFEADGRYFPDREYELDLFAEQVFEWVWTLRKWGWYTTTCFCSTEAEVKQRYENKGYTILSRVEESKREVTL